MKLVTREQLLKTEHNVIYSEYNGYDFAESVYIKYSSKHDFKRNDFTCEPFPILCADSDKDDYFMGFETFKEQPIGTEAPVSTFNTFREAFYEPMDTLYIVYSDEDIESWINTLSNLLLKEKK